MSVENPVQPEVLQNKAVASQRPAGEVDPDTLSPLDIDWLMVTAFVYLQNCHYEKAIVLLEAVLSFDRNNFQALKQLCYAYLQAGRYRETLVVCEKLYDLAVGRSVHVAPVYLMHSYALLNLNQKEQAKGWLLKYQSFLGPELHV
ncbi:MAG: tetratricopeptide repeat protein [Gammaproteobacteria bacterium]